MVVPLGVGAVPVVIVFELELGPEFLKLPVEGVGAWRCGGGERHVGSVGRHVAIFLEGRLEEGA